MLNTIVKMFEIDPVTNKAKITSLDDEKAEVGFVEYMRVSSECVRD